MLLALVHTPRFALIVALRQELVILMPADRSGGKGPAPPALRAPRARKPICIGVREDVNSPQEWASRLEALHYADCCKGFRSRSATGSRCGAIGGAPRFRGLEARVRGVSDRRGQMMETAQSRQQVAPGTVAAFARFVFCGGGVGIASSFAVAALASWIPWALANAVVTAVSTLLATELHSRFTFGAGGRATWRQHAQSAGSAAAAYTMTCVATFVLQLLVVAPDAALEQVVYLFASALAGIARFAVLRLVVFARNRSQAAATVRTVPVPAAVARGAASAGSAVLCHAA